MGGRPSPEGNTRTWRLGSSVVVPRGQEYDRSVSGSVLGSMKLLRRLSERLIENRSGAGAYSAGKMLSQKGRFALAAEAFADAEKAFRKHYGDDYEYVSQARLHRAWCYLKLQRFDEGIALYESVRRAEEAYVDTTQARLSAILQQLAHAYDEAGRKEEADRIRAELD